MLQILYWLNNFLTEYERKRDLLTVERRLETDNSKGKVQLMNGPNGSKYAVAFAGSGNAMDKFNEALERDQRHPDFHVKSPKHLAKRLKAAFDQASRETRGRLDAQSYVATDGRNKFRIDVGLQR
jgi:hypothetical protein